MKKVNVSIDQAALPRSLKEINDIKQNAAKSKKRDFLPTNAHNEEEANSAMQAAERARAFVQQNGMRPINPTNNPTRSESDIPKAPVFNKISTDSNHLNGVGDDEVENTEAFTVPEMKSKIRNYTFSDMLGSGFRNYQSKDENPFPDHGQRLVLPSRFLFNDFDTVFARPLEFPQLCLMYAAKVKNDESMFIDILNDTISCDIRDLCKPDFTAFLYWQRLHSFVTIPFNFTWRSRYGNENHYEIKKSKMEVKALDFTKEDLDQYPYFSIPSMRILEEYRLNLEDMRAKGVPTDAYEMLISKAQYCKGNSLEEKIALCKELDMDTLLRLMPEFVKKFSDFGVVEEFKSFDRHFKAKEALEYLKAQAERTATAIDMLLEDSAVSSQDLAEPMAFNDSLNGEINRIETQLSTTGEAAPSSETRKYSIVITDFFPDLQV